MRMITKPELEKKYSIQRDALQRTLEACGFDTSLSEYPEDEIERYLTPARRMIKENGLTLDKVREWATAERQKENKRPSGQSNAHSDPRGIMDKFSHDAGSSIAEMAVDAGFEQIFDRFLDAYYVRMNEYGGLAKDIFQAKIMERTKYHLGQTGETLGLPGAKPDAIDTESLVVDDDEDREL